jgi:hypothetical protein
MIDDEVKMWHKAQCDIILQEMRSPPTSSKSTTDIGYTGGAFYAGEG